MTKWTLAIAVLALGAVACGGDDDNKDDKDAGGNTGDANTGNTGNTSGDANGITIPDGSDECPRDEIPDTWDKYEGMLTMTVSGFMACQKLCGQMEECYTEANCPGIDVFDDCANTNLVACTAKDGGECRKPYEDLLCCSVAAGCDENSPDTCVSTNCATELKAAQDCINADDACLMEAALECLAQGRIIGQPSELSAQPKLDAAAVQRALLHSVRN